MVSFKLSNAKAFWFNWRVWLFVLINFFIERRINYDYTIDSLIVVTFYVKMNQKRCWKVFTRKERNIHIYWNDLNAKETLQTNFTEKFWCCKWSWRKTTNAKCIDVTLKMLQSSIFIWRNGAWTSICWWTSSLGELYEVQSFR